MVGEGEVSINRVRVLGISRDGGGFGSAANKPLLRGTVRWCQAYEGVGNALLLRQK